jgi:hypothetical protein
VSSHDHPIFNKIDTYYTYIDYQFYKRCNIFFQEFVHSEDTDLFIEDFKSRSYMKKYSTDEVIVSVMDRKADIEDKMNLVKFILRGTNFQKTVKRAYQIIPEFLALLAGLLVNLLLRLGDIMTLWNDFKAKQSVRYKILKYKDAIKDHNYDTLKYLQEHSSNKEIIFDKNFQDFSKIEKKNISIHSISKKN